MSTGVPLHQTLRELEDLLADSALDLTVLDRIGKLADCTPQALIDRCVLVRSDRTANTGQYRDQGLARARDTLTVEGAHRITPTKQRDSRDRALLLEEQVRVLLTSLAPQQERHLSFISAVRGLHPSDGTWWLYSLTFTADRDAALGG